MVVVEDGPATFGPAPNLRVLLRLLDEHGSVQLSETSTIGTSWALLDHPTGPMAGTELRREAVVHRRRRPGRHHHQLPGSAA